MHPTLIENVRQPISTAELERRWAETRKAMAKQGIDCLVMQNSNQYLAGTSGGSPTCLLRKVTP